MEKDYFVTWGFLGDTQVMSAVARISYPPHDEPKGSVLEELAAEAVADQNPPTHPDVVSIFSVLELPNAVWLRSGTTYEAVVGGRYASLEAGHAGWRIHL